METTDMIKAQKQAIIDLMQQIIHQTELQEQVIESKELPW